jgi:hypothetical protein
MIKEHKMINEHKILNWAIGSAIFFIFTIAAIGFYFEKHKNVPPKVVRNVVVPTVIPVPTQTYNYMTITRGSAPLDISKNQKVAVVEVSEINGWLQNSKGKAIISIIPFNKGLVSSFAIVYRDM